jgi:Cu(I)/Ag(I) efflux system periplasmic protein CusF
LLRAQIAAIAIVVASAAQAAAPLVDGQVTAVDLERQLITLNHNAIPNVQMPAMTMMFAVTDPAMISSLKAGDHVRFTADFVDGTLTVTSIAPE